MISPLFILGLIILFELSQIKPDQVNQPKLNILTNMTGETGVNLDAGDVVPDLTEASVAVGTVTA